MKKEVIYFAQCPLNSPFFLPILSVYPIENFFGLRITCIAKVAYIGCYCIQCEYIFQMSVKKALELVGEKYSWQCLPNAALIDAVLLASSANKDQSGSGGGVSGASNSANLASSDAAFAAQPKSSAVDLDEGIL